MCQYYPELAPSIVVKKSCRLLVTLETGITFFSLGEIGVIGVINFQYNVLALLLLV